MQTTVSVLKALALLDERLPRPLEVRAFVQRCWHAATCGFANQPEVAASPFPTAFGLLALNELRDESLHEIGARAMAYMAAASTQLAEYFMAIAAWEECRLSGGSPAWAVKAILAMRDCDGLWGASRRNNAIAAAAVLRAGVELSHADELQCILLAAQRTDGGFANLEGSGADLATTYSVFRALRLLSAQPERARLLTYLHSLRTASGGYAPFPSGEPNADATYQVLSMFSWLSS